MAKTIVKIVLQAILFIAAIYLVSLEETKDFFHRYLNIPTSFIVCFLAYWITSLLLKITKKAKLKAGKIPNELRVPSVKDQANVILPILLGVAFIAGSAYAMATAGKNIVVSVLLIVIGVLLIGNALMLVPAGVIRVSNSKLCLRNGDEGSKIDIDKFNEVTLTSHEVIVSHNHNELYRIERMNLQPEHFAQVTNFLKEQLGKKVTIINQEAIVA